MKLIKRNGQEQDFDINKIKRVLDLANKEVEVTKQVEDIDSLASYVLTLIGNVNYTTVETVQDKVEEALMHHNYYDVAKHYILYRNAKLNKKKYTSDEEKILAITNGTSEQVKGDNSNKDPRRVSTQRDYIAGTTCKTLGRKILPKDIVEAHDKAQIHFHDMDYSPVLHMSNCCLVNFKDMFENGFNLNNTHIDTPHSFRTACNLACQIFLHVSQQQYGGMTGSWAHLAKYVQASREKIIKKFSSVTDEELKNKLVKIDLKNEIKEGVQTFQYQIITLSGASQTPFSSMSMNFDECENEQHEKDLSMVIEEVLNQRISGFTDSHGLNVSPIFPKLLYFLDDCNAEPNSKYYYLTELAAKCVSKRMAPDFISAKVQRELKGIEHTYPCMGAARGDELVSIRVEDEDFLDIPIETAFKIIRSVIRVHGGGFHNPSDITKYKDMCGVYKITHIPTGLYYIGSSKNVQRRLNEHKYSMRHKGTLGDNYLINDFDTDNLRFDILEECSIDDLWKIESKYVNLEDPMCVNHKDPINNGNFGGDRSFIAMKGLSYSDYKNKAYTWSKEVPENYHIFIKSRGEWEPILSIMYNEEYSPLSIYEVSYDKDGEVKKLHITEDHPLHTSRGRVRADNLTYGDVIYDSNTFKEYKIVGIKKTYEKVKTYDFEVSNDMFDLSGIVSHNCRSFLTTEGSYMDNGVEKKCTETFYGRHNNGVVTINLPYVALESERNIEKFWSILDDRLELCYRALVERYKSLKGTPSTIAPILWMEGALSRKKADETIDDLITGWRCTYSLGYVGLWETTYYMTGKTMIDNKQFSLDILNFFQKKHKEWHTRLMDSNNPNSFLNTSSYGTPEENFTDRAARALQAKFGIIEGVTDHDYITNSYHINPSYKIDAFSKLKFESEFQNLSTGGAISYVELPNMDNNMEALLEVIKFMYDNTLYAECNLRIDKCVCGYVGEISLLKDNNGKYYWKCPNCKTSEPSNMSILRRVCGYIGNVETGMSNGRLSDIMDRKLHL